jgi:hypothetical protein
VYVQAKPLKGTAHMKALVVAVALVFGVGGLAACGDDDGGTVRNLNEEDGVPEGGSVSGSGSGSGATSGSGASTESSSPSAVESGSPSGATTGSPSSSGSGSGSASS